VTDRLWGLPALLLGLYFLLLPRERWRREAESDARRAQKIFPWMSERRVQAEVRQQLILRWIVPPIFIVVGVLSLLGVLEFGEQ
jgi:hypothetical protein